MIKRLLFSIKMAWKFRKDISKIKNSDLATENITEITNFIIIKHNICALVLDFDGVMAAHGDAEPNEEVYRWLNDLIQKMPVLKFYILSNNPWKMREDYFKLHFPQVIFISGVKKKPYPDGMLKICETANLNPNQVAIVDDRLLTGCLASELAGCKSFWIYKPYTNIRKHPTQELFFQFLRFIEKKIY